MEGVGARSEGSHARSEGSRASRGRQSELGRGTAQPGPAVLEPCAACHLAGGLQRGVHISVLAQADGMKRVETSRGEGAEHTKRRLDLRAVVVVVALGEAPLVRGEERFGGGGWAGRQGA